MSLSFQCLKELIEGYKIASEIRERAIFLLSCMNELITFFKEESSNSDTVKEDGSFVTDIDLRVNNFLISKLIDKFPRDCILSEEVHDGKNDVMLNKSEYTWTIDPIDGTASYIAGVPIYSTLISLLLNGRPIFGLSLLPALLECMFAVTGLGSYRLTVEGCERLEFNRDNGIRDFLWSSSCLKKIPSRLRKNLNLWCRYERTFPDAYGHLLVIRGKINIMVAPTHC